MPLEPADLTLVLLALAVRTSVGGGIHANAQRRGRGLRTIGTSVGDEPAWILPNTVKPCRS